MGEKDWVFEVLRRRGLHAAARVVSSFVAGKLRGVEDLVKCALCPNMCKFACPTHVASGSEAHSPAGRARIAFYVERGVLELASENAAPLLTCMGCEACKHYCPFGFSVPELTFSVRSKLWRAGAVTERVTQAAENLKRFGNPRGPLQPEQDREGGKVLYIRGCVVRERLPELAKLTVDVFESLGVPLSTSGREACCGFIAYQMGAEGLLRELARRNLELLDDPRWDYAITSCPVTAYTYRVLYPRFGIRPKKPVYHVAELLAKLLAERRGELREVAKEVVVHEPWALSRGLELEGVLTEVLKLVPGLRATLPVRQGKETFDVGVYCNLLGFVDEELAIEVARERLNELREAGGCVVTAMPDAMLVFRELGAECLDVVEVVAEALGL